MPRDELPAKDLPFGQDEYDRRIALTRQAMQARGIELLFITDPSNQAWLTGYDGWSFYVHQGVLLSLDGEPQWWGRMQDRNGALRTVWMQDANVLGYSEHFIQSEDCHPMEDLAGILAQHGGPSARIGVEMENYYYSARAHAVLGRSLPDATLIDATGLVNWQRVIKSAPEIAFMRYAARLTESMLMRAFELAEPGRQKNRLVGDIVQAAYHGVDAIWGDYPAIVPLTPSGADATAPHLTWNGAPMKSGEATFFELSGCYRRYHAPLSRTLHLGPPPADMVNAALALNDGLAAGIEAARAGNRACDIAAALNGVLARIGIDRPARCGYSIGLGYPPDWGERTISLSPRDQTVLQPGMTLHFMPGLWMDGWGIETTESILIRDSGPAETLCNVERKLFVKE